MRRQLHMQMQMHLAASGWRQCWVCGMLCTMIVLAPGSMKLIAVLGAVNVAVRMADMGHRQQRAGPYHLRWQRVCDVIKPAPG